MGILDGASGGRAAGSAILGGRAAAGAARQLFDELDPIGRFAAEWLIEDPGFLTTEELAIGYADFLRDNDTRPRWTNAS